MLDNNFKKEEFKKSVRENVKMLYRKTIEEASQEQIFQAVSLAVKDVIIDNWLLTQKQYEKDDPKIVYYLSMEFLMGRALGNNLINLCAYNEVKEALEELGFDLNVIEDQEPDPALEDWQHVSWIPWQLWVTVLTAAVSVTTMVCSNRRSRTDSRWKYRITG